MYFHSVFAGLIAPNKNIWILGDVFLTDAIAVLMQMQMQEKDGLYLHSAYGVQPYYPKKLCSDSFGKQVRSQLYSALEEHNRLPAVIIVVIGNGKIDDKVSTPFHTRRVWNALCVEIDRAIKSRKNDLPRKAYLNEEPRVFFTEMFPTSKNHCEDLGSGFDSFKSKRRRLNNVLPQVLAKYKFEIMQINGIDPNLDENFVASTGHLSGKGTEIFWKAVARELKLADEKLKETIKNNIIKSYLEDKNEQELIAREKDKIRQDRFSAPRSFPRQRQDRGDGPRFGKNVSGPERSHHKQRGGSVV